MFSDLLSFPQAPGVMASTSTFRYSRHSVTTLLPALLRASYVNPAMCGVAIKLSRENKGEWQHGSVS
jgi:hypothetical protein